MERKLFVLTLSAVFLPYAVVTAPTMIESVNQFWLFPFWTYIHDLWEWMELGIIFPAYIYPKPLALFYLGLVWLSIGLITSLFTFRVWYDQVKIQIMKRDIIMVLIIQVILTMLIVSAYWDSLMGPLIIPLPLHTAVVSILLFHRQNIIKSAT